jgi:transposase
MLAHIAQLTSRNPALFAPAPDCTLPANDDTGLLYASSECSSPLILWDDGMALFWLGDDQWNAIAPLLPSRLTGPKRSDDRVIISGIVHVLICGIAWRDCPAEYGPSMTVFNRFNRWKHRGLWDRIAAALTDPATSTLSAEQSARLVAAMNTRVSVATQRPAPRLPDLSTHAWDNAAAQLRRIAQAHHGKPISAWVEAVVEWHMDSLFAHMESATPPQAPGTHTEMHELRTAMIEAITSLRAYVDDPDRNRTAVKQQLTTLRYDLMQSASPRRRSAS